MLIAKLGLVALIGCLPLSVWSGQGNAAIEAPIFDTHPDPTLGTFVYRVVESNPLLQAARAGLQSSQALESAAAQPLYNPEVEVDYEDAVDKTWQAGIGIALDWSGKRDARTSLAAQDRSAVEAQYLSIKRELSVDLLSGLMRYQTELQRNTLAEERVQAMGDFAALAQRRFSAGDLNQVEADLATLAFLDAKIQKATAAVDLAESRQMVWNIAQNSAPDQWPLINTRPPSVPVSNEPQEVVQKLPEIQAAQRRVDAANAAVELRKLEQKPDPTVSLRGGQEGDSTLVGARLSIPLYLRNSFKFEVSAALAERDQVQQMADDLLRRAYYRYISATERYQLSRDAWQDWDQTGQASLQRQAGLLRRLWEAGELSTTDFLVQLKQTLDTRENALNLELAMWRAWFEWLAASGQVDNWLLPGGKS